MRTLVASSSPRRVLQWDMRLSCRTADGPDALARTHCVDDTVSPNEAVQSPVRQQPRGDRNGVGLSYSTLRSVQHLAREAGSAADMQHGSMQRAADQADMHAATASAAPATHGAFPSLGGTQRDGWQQHVDADGRLRRDTQGQHGRLPYHESLEHEPSSACVACGHRFNEEV
jgi:hypothetical protein